MTALRTFIFALAVSTATVAASAQSSENGNGDGPCASAVGEECQAGSAATFSFTEIEVLEAEDQRGVYVAQVGSSNRADARQTNSNSRARILQDGEQNQADVTQD